MSAVMVMCSAVLTHLVGQFIVTKDVLPAFVSCNILMFIFYFHYEVLGFKDTARSITVNEGETSREIQIISEYISNNVSETNISITTSGTATLSKPVCMLTLLTSLHANSALQMQKLSTVKGIWNVAT